jgi:hypothetical protein
MTSKRAERLTGYEIRRTAEKSGKVTYGAFQDDELVTFGTHRIDELALRVLVKETYELHAIQVLKQNHWRCARGGLSACKSVTAGIGPTAVPIASRILSRSARTATKSSISWSARNDGQRPSFII